MSPEDHYKQVNLDEITLDRGSHPNRDNGICLLEAVAWWANERHTDHPACVSPVLVNFGIALNGQFDHARRQQLKPLIPLLPGTANDGLDEARGYLALDWLVRTYTPTWLDLAGFSDIAHELRSLGRVIDMNTAQSAGSVVRAAGDAVRSAVGAATRAAGRVAAGAAAQAAAGDAAGSVVRATVGDAVGAAARAAAWVAGGAVASAAAGDAAWDALKADR